MEQIPCNPISHGPIPTRRVDLVARSGCPDNESVDGLVRPCAWPGGNGGEIIEWDDGEVE